MHKDINLLISLNRQITGAKSLHDFRQYDVFCIAGTGEKIRFLPHSLIKISLINLLSKIDTTHNPIKKLALYWIGLIAIHPFENGNGRTVKKLIKLKAKEMSLEISNLEQLDSILLTENTEKNIHKITNFIKLNIKENV